MFSQLLGEGGFAHTFGPVQTNFKDRIHYCVLKIYDYPSIDDASNRRIYLEENAPARFTKPVFFPKNVEKRDQTNKLAKM
jgi:hypothetical protein